MSLASRQGFLKQRGFILSIEAVLLFSVVGIGLMVGLVVLRDALIRLYVSGQEARFIVADSASPPTFIGTALGFDEHESPVLVFTDYDPLGTGINFRSLLGVRADRFTSRQVVLYQSTDCNSTYALPVCIAKTGSEAANVLVRNRTGVSASTSQLYPLQGYGPVYAVGRGFTDTDQGRLYRAGYSAGENPEPLACPANSLNSAWLSMADSSESCVLFTTPVTSDDLMNFHEAVEVLMTDNVTNVLQGLVPPFFTNMVGNPLTDFSSIDPAAERP
jgi:hypothetical protein